MTKNSSHLGVETLGAGVCACSVRRSRRLRVHVEARRQLYLSSSGTVHPGGVSLDLVVF